MSLLDNLFNVDELEIRNINKKYFVVLIIMVILLLLSIVIKKTNYYTNSFTIIDGNIVLLVEKDYVSKVKNSKKIVIDDIENKYSINNITLTDNIYMFSIELNTKLSNITSGEYKIFLGKESLFDFIVRIIIK